MNIEDLRTYCIKKPFVTEEFPFDESVLVFKVAGKIFLLTDVNDYKSINLKGEPETNIELREKFYFIKPGYHMNKKHWNTVTLEDELTYNLLTQMIDTSYNLVYQNLPLKLRNELNKSVL